MIDWNAYRQNYDNLSYEQQLAFYDEVWNLHPVQKHYDSDTCALFLNSVKPQEIIEIGGWRGELAEELIRYFPDIISWKNFEICRGAAESPVCTDDRYEAIVPEQWVWDSPYITPGKTLIASHVIEHMNAQQLNLLLEALKPSAAFIASPLTEEGQDWAGYIGSHILKLGWKDVITLFAKYGLTHDSQFDTSEVRCFR